MYLATISTIVGSRTVDYVDYDSCILQFMAIQKNNQFLKLSSGQERQKVIHFVVFSVLC